MEDSVSESEILKMSTPNGKKVEDEEKVSREVIVIDGEKEDFEPSGGILGNFISSLVSPKVRESEEKVNGEGGDGDGKRKREDEVGSREVNLENGGSVFNNLISNIFHKNEGENGGENGVGEENKKVKVDEDGGGGSGGGMINNIVSKLPTSLPEEAAPPTDEASILIHSIIHD